MKSKLIRDNPIIDTSNPPLFLAFFWNDIKATNLEVAREGESNGPTTLPRETSFAKYNDRGMPSSTRLVPLGRLELLRRTRTQFKHMANVIQHKFNLRPLGVEPQLPLERGGEASTGRLQEGQDWLGGSTGQAPTWCGRKQLEHL